MALDLEPLHSALSAQWLTSRTFTFRVETTDRTLSNTFLFQKNGFILGYGHANECYWEIEDDGVNILDIHGKVTCRMQPAAPKDGKGVLSGKFIDPALVYDETDTVHSLVENDSDYHTRVQSFDLFDTLVARRCMAPLDVFRRVEEKSGYVGFATRRHLVEMKVFGKFTYGLDDIYAMLVAEKTLDERQATVAKAMELQEEWDQLMPIAQTVALVGENDIVISDMYLPQAFVERVLREKCGLNNKLYLSNYGKHHRTIWPAIKAAHPLRMHYGDNPHADVSSPNAFDIPAKLVTVSKWDQTEELMHKLGFGAYAHALREVRLETFHPNTRLRNAMQGQIRINFPLMLLAAHWLRHTAQDFGADRLLMAARDCSMLHRLVNSEHFVRHGMPEARYIRISRPLCYAATAEYEAYLRGQFSAKALLVDFVGTGRSIMSLMDAFDLGNRIKPCILVSELAELIPEAGRVDAFIRRDFFTHRVFLEALNASLEGSAVEARDENGLIVIDQQVNEFSETMQEMIAIMHATFERFLPLIARLPAMPKVPPDEVLKAAAEMISEFIPASARRLEYIALAQGRALRRALPIGETRS